MSNQKPGMFTPALIGGAIAGVLSGIPFLNCLCCLWIIGGAMLASYLFIKDSSVTLGAGDGAIIGIFSGIIAAVVHALISIPLYAVNRQFILRIMERFAEYTEEMPSGWESWFERGAGLDLPFFMLNLVISAVIFAVLGLLGGIIGISLFGKKTSSSEQKS